MNFIHLIAAFTTLFAAVLGVEAAAIKNTTQEYYLKTALKPNQPGKGRFDGLYIVAYHTGAGLDDACFYKDRTASIKGFLNGTNGEVNGVKYQNQVFDVGASFPFIMIPEPEVNFYAAWEPVRINAGAGASDPKAQSGFWINGTGLQWTPDLKERPNSSENIFAGWLVCDWWHGAEYPQLFFRINFYSDYPAPCSCADVWLSPEYI